MYTPYSVRVAKLTNVLLDPVVRAAAKRRARERCLSVSAYIRELIRADDAAARATEGDITPLIGVLGTGTEPSDIARHKHEMVRQSFSENLDRKRPNRARPG